MIMIILRVQDHEVLIDEEDFHHYFKYHERFKNWKVSYDGYLIKRIIGGELFYFHRLILGFPEGYVDHINHNKLDNRKCNLRICTPSESNAHRRKQKSMDGFPTSSKYKGVTWNRRRKKWISRIRFNNKLYFLGYYRKEENAAKAYNEAALKLHGEFAILNNGG